LLFFIYLFFPPVVLEFELRALFFWGKHYHLSQVPSPAGFLKKF
jgi:hypothetical protein